MKNTGKMLIAGVVFAGAGLAGAHAGDKNMSVYHPIQGLSYSVGSKLAVGYFTQQDGACLLNLFVAENTGDRPSASHLQFKVTPGENVIFNTPEGEALEMKCGTGGATLEVKGGTIPARYVSR
ncbi:MAG: hypothetical protein WCD20_05920 [Rhodomicrobium sp.]